MKNIELKSELEELKNAENLSEEIKKTETKLQDAERDGDTESSAFYSKKLEDLNEDLSKSQKEIRDMQTYRSGETLGYSSDYYENEMARALEKGNDVAYKNAKKHWAEAKAEEETKKATNS